jgi:hypothetical protein
LNTCHATLAQAQGDEASDRNKVAKMLKGMTTVNLLLVAAMQNIRSNPNSKNNFTAASSELSKQIALVFPGEPLPSTQQSPSGWSWIRQPEQGWWLGTWPWL